jgi:hypothetical protein
MNDIQSGFHWRDGWYFKRLEDGSVRVSHVTHPPFEGKLEQQFVISENEWASIVCSVSAEGETSQRWQKAREFHGAATTTSTQGRNNRPWPNGGIESFSEGDEPPEMIGTEALGNGNDHFGRHEQNEFCERRGCVLAERAVADDLEKLQREEKFACRVCGVQCPVAPKPPERPVCEEHCEDHDYRYAPDFRQHRRIHCDKPAPEDWFDE